jgi:hypothetical protein
MGGSIFALHIDWYIVTSSMIGLVMFTMCLEHLLHMLEHSLRTHPAFLKMVGKMYKELMILGVVSFGLIMTISSVKLPDGALVTFEFVHVWIFLVAVFFIIHSVLFMGLMSRAKKKWDAINYM